MNIIKIIFTLAAIGLMVILIINFGFIQNWVWYYESYLYIGCNMSKACIDSNQWVYDENTNSYIEQAGTYCAELKQECESHNKHHEAYRKWLKEQYGW